MSTRVLVIDDDHALRRSFVEAVEDLGCEVEDASNGLLGVSYFAKRKHDVVVTDLRMPGLHGWDVAHAVRRLRPDVGLVVLCSTDTDVADAGAEIADLDQLVVLVKPVDLEQLREAVGSAVGAHFQNR